MEIHHTKKYSPEVFQEEHHICKQYELETFTKILDAINAIRSE
jgi:hypothetical protein